MGGIWHFLGALPLRASLAWHLFHPGSAERIQREEADCVWYDNWVSLIKICWLLTACRSLMIFCLYIEINQSYKMQQSLFDLVHVFGALVLQSAGSQHFLVLFRVFEFDVLKEAALRSVATVTLFGFAVVALLYFVGSPPKPLFAFGSFFPHFIFKLLLSSFLDRVILTS